MTDSFIGIPGSTQKLDGASVTTGYSGGTVLREGVYIGDPDTGTAQAAVMNTDPVNGEYGLIVRLAGEAEVHAFSDALVVALDGTIHSLPAKRVDILGARSRGWSSTSVLGDCCEYLDTTQPKLNTPTSGQTLYLRSTNAGDAASGTGIKTVRTVYLDATGLQQVRTDTLNGTTVVNIGSGYTAIQWMESATIGANGVADGDVTISSTNGAATVATTFEMIAAGSGRSLSGRYNVPSNSQAILLDWNANAIGTTMDVRLRADVFMDDNSLSLGAFHFVDRAFLASGGGADRDGHYRVFPAGCTIKASAIPGNAPAGNKLDFGMTMFVLENP
jgi:hypothetical protein